MSIIGGIIMGAFALGLVALVFLAALWALTDAEGRGIRGWPVFLLVLVMHVPGLLLWLVFRPDKTKRPAAQRSATAGHAT